MKRFFVILIAVLLCLLVSCDPTQIGQKEKEETSITPLTFTAIEASSITLVSGSNSFGNLVYSRDNESYSQYTCGNEITLNAGETVYFKVSDGNEDAVKLLSSSSLYGESKSPEIDENLYCHFEMSGKISASGNVMSLLYSSGNETSVPANAFNSLFKGCESLVSAPELPATTLGSNCYANMFSGCTSLVNAPELPAQTLVSGCYAYMFSGCSSLKTIKIEFENVVSDAITGWLSDVSENLIVTITSDVKAGDIGLEEDVTIITTDNALCFTATEDSSSIRLNASTWVEKGESALPSIYYSLNGGTWKEYAFTQGSGLNYKGEVIELDEGDVVCFKGTSNTFSFSTTAFLKFVMTGKIKASGSVLYLLNEDGEAESLSDYVFYSLFSGCTSLISAPELLALKLGTHCYEKMFNGCTAMLQGPSVLPAETLAVDCYKNMFKGCTAMTQGPSEISAKTLLEGCYKELFSGCTALKSAPALPATVLTANCYESMFSGCKVLMSAPALSATSLADSCYESMFYGCTSISSVPELPATNLAEKCYRNMFYGCTSIACVENIAATTFANYCFENMFASCSNISKVFFEFTSWGDKTDFFKNWLDGVSSKGMFICADDKYASFKDTVKGASSIPTGWEWVKKSDYDKLYGPLSFTSTGSSTIQLSKSGSPTEVKLLYSTDGSTWNDYNFTEINLSDGASVYFKAKEANNLSESDSAYYKFSMTGSLKASGNIMWLLNPNGDSKTVNNYSFYSLFSGCSALTEAPKLPAKTLGKHCYELMFSGTGLTEMPSLSDASELKDYCYSGMFKGCTSLSTAPVLNSTNLAEYCYSGMFEGCEKITTAPALNSTDLAEYCYSGMFAGCTGLTTAPALPASTLATGCYNSMFKDCTSLTSLSSFGFTAFTSGCFDNWLYNVGSGGLFVSDFKNLNSFEKSDSTIPEKWTVVNTSLGLAFVAKAENSKIGIVKKNNPSSSSISYSTNGGESWITTSKTVSDIDISTGSVIYFKGSNTALSSSTSNYWYFEMIGEFEAYGDVTKLIGGNKTITQKDCFYYLFYNCISLTRAPKIGLTTVSEEGLSKMFYGCSNLVVGPDMSSITTVAKKSCFHMFNGCSKLESVQMPNATTMYQECYSQMFYNCYALESVSISATTLAQKCFNSMFYNCTGLKSLTVFFTAWNPNSYSNIPTNSWLSGAGSTSSVLYCPEGLDTTKTGASYIPEGWDVQTK